MPKIETKIDTSSVKFKSNYEHHKALSDDLTSVLDKVREMGPHHRIEKHHKRGKLTARERIDKLKDENTDFLEFSEICLQGLALKVAPQYLLQPPPRW